MKTDMALEEAMDFAIKGATMDPNSIKFYMLEGEAQMINGASYWIHDPAALETLLYGFYGFDIGGLEETTESGEENTTEEDANN